LNIFPFPSDSNSNPHQNQGLPAEYADWLQDLKPRTCLLVHWLASMGAIYEPDAPTHDKARKFAGKRVLLGKLVENTDESLSNKTSRLIENKDFDLYVAYLMWLRFNEYVPRRFVLPEGRTKVLGWVRQQLRRTELTDEETIVELQYQIDRIHYSLGETDEIQSYFKA
jgi:hypothetical protein